MFDRTKLQDKLPAEVFARIESYITLLENDEKKSKSSKYFSRIVKECNVADIDAMKSLVDEYYASL